MTPTERVADLIEQQNDLRLTETQGEMLRASAFLAVTSIPGVTSGVFADAAVLVLGVNKQGARNRYNESAQVWGDEFRYEGAA